MKRNDSYYVYYVKYRRSFKFHTCSLRPSFFDTSGNLQNAKIKVDYLYIYTTVFRRALIVRYVTLVKTYVHLLTAPYLTTISQSERECDDETS